MLARVERRRRRGVVVGSQTQGSGQVNAFARNAPPGFFRGSLGGIAFFGATEGVRLMCGVPGHSLESWATPRARPYHLRAWSVHARRFASRREGKRPRVVCSRSGETDPHRRPKRLRCIRRPGHAGLSGPGVARTPTRRHTQAFCGASISLPRDVLLAPQRANYVEVLL
eukprot:gene25869-biopygen13562